MPPFHKLQRLSSFLYIRSNSICVATPCIARRNLATHRDHPPSSLLDRVGGPNTSGGVGGSGPGFTPNSRGSVGPFVLGIQPSKSDEKVKKWSELSAGEKVIRTTARTTNLTVILIGAGLSAVLVYALATELFAKNSPTVLYGEACEKIKASPQVSKYLNGQISFHTTPPSPIPPRHRNRHPQSLITTDSKGAEHLLLHFWISSSASSSTSSTAKDSLWHRVTSGDWDWDWHWVRVEEFYAYSKEKAKELVNSARRTFAYVSGTPVPPPAYPEIKPFKPAAPPPQPESSSWSLVGIFRGMSRRRGVPAGSGAADLSASGGYDSGEVHVDYVKDENGIFKCRYLVVYVPNSKVRNPIRVLVDKGPGFNEGDPVWMWGS